MINRHTPLEDLEAFLRDALQKKSITNPDYRDLKDLLNRHVAKSVPHVKGVSDAEQDRKLRMTAYQCDIVNVSDFTSLNDVLFLPKKIAAAEKAIPEAVSRCIDPEVATSYFKQIIANEKAFCQRWLPVAQAMKALKAYVVKITAVRQQKKEQATLVLKKKFSDSRSLVSTLSKFKEAFVARARALAEKVVLGRVTKLEECGWDLDVAAPRSDHWSTTLLANDLRNAYRSISEDDGRRVVDGKTHQFRRKSPQAEEAYIKAEEAAASASYDSFIAKMVEKIGKPVVQSDFSGDPWTGSVLTVKCADGEEQRWNTQMIINQSKYGKLFNQFPSRRMT